MDQEVVLQMVWILNGIQNPEAQPFEIQTNDCHLVQNHLKSGQKGLDIKWSGFQMVGFQILIVNIVLGQKCLTQ